MRRRERFRKLHTSGKCYDTVKLKVGDEVNATIFSVGRLVYRPFEAVS